MESNQTSPEPQPILPTPYVSPRRDGWTAARQQAFLKALAACGCVTDACRSVGMSRESAYNLYDRPAATAFRAAWDAAVDCGLRRVEDDAVSRSIKGVARPIFYRGEQVGEYRHYDERLTMFLLRYRRSHRYCEPSQRWVSPPPPGCEEEEPNDTEQAVGLLDWHLGDLVDEADLPGAGDAPPTPDDGVNFVNFETDCDNPEPPVEPGP